MQTEIPAHLAHRSVWQQRVVYCLLCCLGFCRAKIKLKRFCKAFTTRKILFHVVYRSHILPDAAYQVNARLIHV
jgi:hypothetical protein